MALWSIMAVPLILSVDLRTISDWAREIILNKNLIAINQDPLGAMGQRILKVTIHFYLPEIEFILCFQLNGHVEVWSKSLKDERTAVSVEYVGFVLLNMIFSLLPFFRNHMAHRFI